MTTLTITLSDETFGQLREAASDGGETPAELVGEILDAVKAAGLKDFARRVRELRSGSDALPPPGRALPFREAMAYVLRKNEELNRRLAQ